MNNPPPPIRPWFRLASQIRVEPPPQSRPVPTLVQASMVPAAPPVVNPSPLSPKPTPLAPALPAPTSPVSKSSVLSPKTSLPTSPLLKTSEPTTSPKPKTYSPPKSSPPPPQKSSSPAPNEYFKIVEPSLTKTPPQYPKITPSAPPPSPLSLPPSRLNPVPEPESKTVVMAENKSVFLREEKEMKNHESHRNIGENTANNNKHNSGVGTNHKKEYNFLRKKPNEDDEEGVRVITISGENKGAYMELSSSKNKANPQHLNKSIPQARNSDGNDSSTCSNNEAKSKKNTTTTRMKAFVNSNVQGVNNSILFNSSCAHSDPGVHLLISKKPPTS